LSKNKRFKKPEAVDMLTPDRESTRINWFPGHMNKALKKIKERMKMVDIVLELRDARSPLATGNMALRNILGEKTKLILINKTNLADPKIIAQWDKWFATKSDPYLFINAFDKRSINEIVSKSLKVVNEKIKISNPENEGKKKLKMMIIGLPNTGKSTIINRLASRNATKVADKPGQTQHQLWVKIDENFEILDTPGVMYPDVKSHEQGLWLSALHTIPDRIAGTEAIACFIVEHLLKNNPKVLESKYGIDTDGLSMNETLDKIAAKRGCILQKGEFDYDRTFAVVIGDFRKSELGPISFGVPPQIKT